jgi:short subunit dehydrogenase-like uncharacterized protein
VSESKRDRMYDVIVYGATGFTGQLVAAYFARQYGVGKDLRWAIAGRSAKKLQALRDSLGEGSGGLDVIVADSTDRPALASLARQTRVVLSTVGPYALYGSELVAACVDAGTDYCDLAGEVQWIRRMIDAHQERAAQTGARIVHCCGFDSIPSDIGVWFLQDHAREAYGSTCRSITLYVKATKGTLSGGTLASMANIIEETRNDRSIARIIANPYALNPEGVREGPDGYDQQRVLFDEDAQCWTAPFVMGGINMRIVRRSNALAGFPYGKAFSYRETMMTGRGISGWLKATMVTLALAGLVLGMSLGPTRRFLQRFVLPKPGEGPSPELQKNGFFKLLQIGHLPDDRILRTEITGDQDPGYGSTSKMLSEAAVCLARDPLQVGGGVWTPAAAMGAPLLARLRANAGLTFEVI